MAGSWAAAVVDELEQKPEDIRVDKYRMSGFWDTPLDSILRNLGKTTLFFGGVNADQCVMATLQDANFLGYDCILVEDCTATTSPEYCWQATLYNVKQCFGFVTNSQAILKAITHSFWMKEVQILIEPTAVKTTNHMMSLHIGNIKNSCSYSHQRLSAFISLYLR